MNHDITYQKISPLVQYVEVAAGMIECHFHCPIKSKRVVAITHYSQSTEKAVTKTSSLADTMTTLTFPNLRKYFSLREMNNQLIDPKLQKEKAIVHSFEKISERFIYSDEHKHFVYRF